MKTVPRFGFAAADLLVAIALAIVSATLVLPAVQKLRADADRATCADNLRQIGRAVGAFADANGGQLPHNRTAVPRGSWNTQLLPFLGKESLARQYVPGDDWAAAGSANRDVVRTPISIYVCPAGPNPRRTVLTQDADPQEKPFRAGATDYVGSAGAYYQKTGPENLHVGAMHHRTIERRILTADVLDGTSYTLFVVEMADKPNRWQAGKLVEDRTEKPQTPAIAGQWAAPNWNHLRSHAADGREQFGPCAVNCTNQAAIYGFHTGGANVLMVDGTVRFLKAGMSQEMLIALVSMAGGELLGPNDF